MKRNKIMILGATILVGIFFTVYATGNIPGMGACPSEAEHDHKHHVEGEDNGHHSGEKGSHHKLVRLSEEAMEAEGVEVGAAGPGTLRISVSLPGEVAINSDRMAHIVPLLGGIVRAVRKKAGDTVRAGEVLAVMESRELAEAKAKYLAALKRLALAKSNHGRYEMLWRKEAIPEKQYFEFKTALEEAEIEKDSAEQRLRALGFSEVFLQDLPSQPPESLSRYEMVAPFAGTVINRHIALGEMLKDDTEAFMIADLSTVWVNIQVYPKDLSHVRDGQTVIISAGNGIPDIQGTIEYVEPVVGDRTRAAVARVVLPNPEGRWRPGLFVTARVIVESVDVPVLVPKTALKTMEGKPTAFVREDEGFEPRIVKTGRSDASNVEILAGLQAGDLLASNGTFLLKAEAGKGEAAHEH